MILLLKPKHMELPTIYTVLNENKDAIFYVITKNNNWTNLRIYDSNNQCIAKIKAKRSVISPTVRMHLYGEYIGEVYGKYNRDLHKNLYSLKCKNMWIDGSVQNNDYTIESIYGEKAHISRPRFRKTYRIDIINRNDAELCLVIVLGIIACFNKGEIKIMHKY